MPTDNSRRVWAFGKPRIVKTMPDVRTAAVGFYAINGTSVLRSSERVHKEAICEVFEAIREQNPVGRILLIADNDGGHHANLTQQRADELGIEFVFLPPYSPNFNAIEPLWKSLKRKISPTIFKDKDHFKQFVTVTFLDLSNRLGFANSWIETFISDVQTLR